MIIQLASCNKRKNSTIINGIWDMSKECSLKNPTSVMTPVVTLYDNSDRLLKYNYAYIPDFNRYYFIDDIILEDTGNVTLTMSIDVLASYRDEIANSDIYYLRGPQSVANGYIIDSFFPLTTQAECKLSNFYPANDPTWSWPDEFTEGYYVIITAGVQTAANTTGQTVYQLSPAEFKQLVNKLMALSDEEDFGDLPQGVKNSLYSPLDYVAGCYWSPIGFPTGVYQNVSFGKWTPDLFAATLTGAPGRINMYAQVQPWTHDFTNKPYLLQKPYSRFVVSTGFMSDFEIDGALLYDGVHDNMLIELDFMVDPANGTSILNVYPAYQVYTNNTWVPYRRSDIKLATMQCNMLVPVNLSTVKNNMLDVAGQAVNGLGQLLTGNPLGAIGSFLNAGITAADNVITGGTVSNVAGNGSMAKQFAPKRLVQQYFKQVQVNHADKGYPCCKRLRAVNGNVGYYQGMDVHLRINTATREETQLAEALIESGYFYE